MEEVVNSKKKKIVISFGFVALGILAIVGIIVAFLMNYNSHSPKTPIILDDGKNISITTNMNDNYMGYRFKFKNGEDEIIIDSKENILSLDTMFEHNIEVGKTYKISVCYLGETAGSGSEYSKQTIWTCQKYLDAVEIENDVQNQMILWEEVDQADYYTVYFNENGQLSEYVTEDLFFDYSAIAGGEKQVYVVASSISANYKDSFSSNTLSYTHQYKHKNIERAAFNSGTMELSVHAVEELEFINVIIGGMTYVVKLEGKKQEDFVYNIDLISVYVPGAQIGVAPYPADANSVFEGDVLYI